MWLQIPFLVPKITANPGKVKRETNLLPSLQASLSDISAINTVLKREAVDSCDVIHWLSRSHDILQKPKM